MLSIFRHIRAWLRRGRLDEELREELAQHVEWKTDSLIADGVPEREARRRAAVTVGNLTRLREDSRRVWGFPRLETIAQDVRYGLRQMRRAPGFTAIAILSLAIGIGARAAVFSLADRMLFRKLPAPGPLRPLKAIAPPWAAPQWPPEHLPNDGPRVALLAGCVASVVFGDDSVGYATVRGGQQRTIDGGTRWTPLRTPGTYLPP